MRQDEKAEYHQSMKIVADSSADILELPQIPFAVTPLKIRTEEKEYVDDAQLDVDVMVEELSRYEGRSSTSCPNPEDWLAAFGEAEQVFCVTITSALSGSYNAACIAQKTYEQQHPGRRVCVIDSLSAGPEMALIIRHLEELIEAGHAYEEICRDIREYQKRTKLIFMLESMQNLANNGRVGKMTAKVAGIMGIRVVGKASKEGTLEPLTKPRGAKKARQAMMDLLENLECAGSRIQIAHCFNHDFANELKRRIHERYPQASVRIEQCRGLCSYYAEKGGILLGFETIKGV